MFEYLGNYSHSQSPASILYKSIAGRYRPVRVADGPITARYRFIKNAYWVQTHAAQTSFIKICTEYSSRLV